MDGISASKKGKDMEKIISSYLPKSRVVKGFDVLWNKIAIEVRYTEKNRKNKWTFRSSPLHGANALICVAKNGNEYITWCVPTNTIKRKLITLDMESEYLSSFDKLQIDLLKTTESVAPIDKETQFILNLPDKLLNEIDEAAKKYYLSRTAYVITTLRVEIQKFKRKQHGNRKKG